MCAVRRQGTHDKDGSRRPVAGMAAAAVDSTVAGLKAAVGRPARARVPKPSKHPAETVPAGPRCDQLPRATRRRAALAVSLGARCNTCRCEARHPARSARPTCDVCLPLPPLLLGARADVEVVWCDIALAATPAAVASEQHGAAHGATARDRPHPPNAPATLLTLHATLLPATLPLGLLLMLPRPLPLPPKL
eukprot:366278-Chlamydomonas_euryale.AAC.50